MDEGFSAASENNNVPADSLELFIQRRSTRRAPVKKDDMSVSDISDNKSTSSGDELDKLVADINNNPNPVVRKKWHPPRHTAPTPSLSISSKKDEDTARFAKLQALQDVLIALAMRDVDDKTSRRRAIRVPSNHK